MTRFIVAVPLLLSLSLAHAQVPSDPAARQAYFDALYARGLDLQERHAITIRGSENPAQLKRGAVLAVFFETLTGGAPRSDAEFAQIAASRFGATGADLAVLQEAGAPRQQAVDVCGPVLDGSLADGLSIAKRFTDINDASDRAAEAHYDAVIKKLTPKVRAKVLQGVNEQAANMDSTTLDHLATAREDPKLFKTMMTALCRGAKNARSSQIPTAPGVVQDQGLISTTER